MILLKNCENILKFVTVMLSKPWTLFSRTRCVTLMIMIMIFYMYRYRVSVILLVINTGKQTQTRLRGPRAWRHKTPTLGVE